MLQPRRLKAAALTVGRAMVRVVALTRPFLLGTPGAAAAAADPLEQRLLAWPAWSLPAPLPRPGRRDLVWPTWFAGDWEVSSEEAEGEGKEEGEEPAMHWHARFHPNGTGGAVADRAFNARAIGQAALGDQLLSVADDPANPNRQLTRLGGDRLLETTVVGRRSALPSDQGFLADELSLQVLHGPGEPRIQRVEVLGRWQLRPDGGIDGEQWQASYPSPAEGLAATGQRPRHLRLRLSPLPPGSNPAS
ncbi:MAG: DUF6816 family protein [Cyanobacteriota bacterium]